MFAREVVEFSSSGLDKLEAEVKSTGNAVEDLRKKNAALRKALTDGTWQREAKALSKARGELKLYANEQQRLQNIAKRQMYDQRFGRFGGGLAYGASRLRGVGGGVLNAASAGFSGALGTAGMFGAALGAGALISRGFSGTSAAARLDMEIEKLSRTVAEKLMPVMNALTNNISRVNQASDRVRAGKGTFGDKVVDRAVSAIVPGSMAMAAWGGVSAMGFRPAAHMGAGISRIASGFAAGSAGRAALMNPATWAFAGSAWMLSQGWDAASFDDRYRDLSTRTIGKGQTRFNFGLSDDERQRFGYLIRNADAAGPDRAEYLKNRRAYASERLAEVEKKIADHRPSRSIYNRNKAVRGFFQAATGGWEGERQKWMMERNVIDRLAAGEQLSGGGLGPLTMRVQGAGERRGLTDLHQEIAEQVAQKLSGRRQEEGDTTIDRIINSINVLVNIGNSLLGALGSNERHSVVP